MRPIRYCVSTGCGQRLADDDEHELPVCRGCWDDAYTPDQREAIWQLVQAGESLVAQLLAALASELPLRAAAAAYFAEQRTWPTMRDGVADRLEREGIDYDQAVGPWREAVGDLFWALGGKWTCVEIACAMTRARIGVNGYEPYLHAAAVDVDEQLAREGVLATDHQPPTTNH